MKPFKHIIIAGIAAFALTACNSNEQPAESSEEPTSNTTVIETPAPAPEPEAEPETKIKVNIGRDEDGNVSGGIDAEVEK